jgi:hypothetical protein
MAFAAMAGGAIERERGVVQLPNARFSDGLLRAVDNQEALGTTLTRLPPSSN